MTLIRPQPAVEPTAAPAPAPLCWGQQWAWHEQQRPAGERSPSVQLGRVIDLPDGVPPSAVRAALDLTIGRHQALRSTFTAGPEGTPQQTVWPVEAWRYEFDELDQFDGEAHCQAWFLRRDLDVSTEWPLRAAIGHLRPETTSLAIVTHHLAADRQALDLLCDELLTTVSTMAQRIAPALPSTDRQPAEIAAFEQSPAGAAVHRRSLAHWLRYGEDLSQLLAELRAGFPTPSPDMHVARVDCGLAARRLAALASAGRGSVAAVAVAAVANALARHLGRRTVPLWMTVANRHRPGYARSICSLAQSALLSVEVRDPGDLLRTIPLAWSGTLHAIRHGYYDSDELAERMRVFDRDGRTTAVAPPSINIVRDSDVSAQPAPHTRVARPHPGSTPPPWDAWAWRINRPCLGLNFHIGISDDRLSIELRAGTHLIDEDAAVALVVNAVRPLLE